MAWRLSPNAVGSVIGPMIRRKTLAALTLISSGLGVGYRFRALEDMWLTAVIERTRNPPWALEGGREGRANRAALSLPDGSACLLAKATRVRVPAGAVVDVETGGGGGYGPPAERRAQDVHADLRDGYVTPARARRDDPHVDAFPGA